MTMENAVEQIVAESDRGNNWVGVYIGALAGLLAIGSVGSGNAAKDATQANIDAADTWAFFQAKNIRHLSLELAADELELMLVTRPDLPSAAARQVRAKLDGYREHAQTLRSEPGKKEGLEQLYREARRLEQERDLALRRDPYFDRSQAILQIAIVLASVHLIVGRRWLLVGSGVLGAVGAVLMMNGFFLFARVPTFG